jgi:glycosyltransferase involved in cell wall biosynthesis
MIPTFHSTPFLAGTLRSVLAQDPGADAMEIIVVDDHSTRDDPRPLVDDIGKGRVGFYRHPQNVGAPANFTACVERASGEWVHILHGDDVVLPGFYQRYERFIDGHPGVRMAFSRAVSVNSRDEMIGISQAPASHRFSGVLSDPLSDLTFVNIISTPTVVVARAAYEAVGGYTPLLPHSADWEMWVRLASSFDVGYIDEPRALYRIHEASDTNRLRRLGRDVPDSLLAVELIVRRLPHERRRETRRRAHALLARHAAYCRRALHDAKAHRAALQHAVWGFRLKPSVRNLGRVLRSGLRAALIRT